MYYHISSIAIYRRIPSKKEMTIAPPPEVKPPKSPASEYVAPLTREWKPAVRELKTPPEVEEEKTLLPHFIRQFVGTEWFDKYFPNANENVSIWRSRYVLVLYSIITLLEASKMILFNS